MLSIRATCERLMISRPTFYRLVEDGDLKATKDRRNGRVWVDEQSVASYLARATVQARIAEKAAS